MFHARFLWRAILALFFLLVSADLFAQVDGAEKRQKLMKDNGASLKAIKAAADANDYATIEAKAKNIIRNGDKVLDLFRKSQTAEKTRAKPEIWEKWDEFSKNPGKVKKAATELADAAKAKDDSVIAVRVNTLSEACASCHSTFRAEKYSE